MKMIEAFHRAVMGACLIGGAIIVCAVAMSMCAYAWRKVRAKLPWGRLSVMLCLAAVCAWAAQKVKTRDYLVRLFNLDPAVQYISQNRSYVEYVDGVAWVHIDFNVHPLVPSDTTFWLDFRPVGSTNGWSHYSTFILTEWQLPRDITPEFLNGSNWTNFEWAVYTDWSPAPFVMTNGVWHARAVRDAKTGRHIVPLKTRLVVHEENEGEQ